MTSEYVLQRLEALGLDPRPVPKNGGRDRENEKRYRREYRKKNAPLFAAYTAARHARQLKRRPPWVDMKALRAIYERARRLSVKTGIKHHVDHIVPLISDVASGLHVPWNLRIVPAGENVRKSNRLPYEFLEISFQRKRTRLIRFPKPDVRRPADEP